jgi:hypothetical protein
MKFRLYREFGSLNSVAIFNAVEQGLKSIGEQIVTQNEDIPVIWSVLWNGRMEKNKYIYEKCARQNSKIMIIEVGNLNRNVTWRISLDHINALGKFANDRDLDENRPSRLGIRLNPYRKQRKNEILIACQHQKSLQWTGMPPINLWLEDTITKIKQHTDRKIRIRPHPRSNFTYTDNRATIERPRMISGTYDSFDIDYDYHCVVNHNSGPPIQAIIDGCPVITDSSSLAWPMSNNFENLEDLKFKDREDWLIKLSHTEWTVDEITKGIPFLRLQSIYKE